MNASFEIHRNNKTIKEYVINKFGSGFKFCLGACSDGMLAVTENCPGVVIEIEGLGLEYK